MGRREIRAAPSLAQSAYKSLSAVYEHGAGDERLAQSHETCNAGGGCFNGSFLERPQALASVLGKCLFSPNDPRPLGKFLEDTRALLLLASQQEQRCQSAGAKDFHIGEFAPQPRAQLRAVDKELAPLIEPAEKRRRCGEGPDPLDQQRRLAVSRVRRHGLILARRIGKSTSLALRPTAFGLHGTGHRLPLREETHRLFRIRLPQPGDDLLGLE